MYRAHVVSIKLVTELYQFYFPKSLSYLCISSLYIHSLVPLCDGSFAIYICCRRRTHYNYSLCNIQIWNTFSLVFFIMADSFRISYIKRIFYYIKSGCPKYQVTCLQSGQIVIGLVVPISGL